MAEEINTAPCGSVPATPFALVHGGLGEQDAAMDWLERGADRHDIPVTVVGTHPAYDSLRTRPRFQALLERMGLAGRKDGFQ